MKVQGHTSHYGQDCCETAGQNTNAHMVTKFTLQVFLMVWTHCTDHDERSEKGIKQVIFCSKYDVASEPEQGTGLALSWSRRFRVWRWEQAMAQCLGNEWVNVAQNSTV